MTGFLRYQLVGVLVGKPAPALLGIALPDVEGLRIRLLILPPGNGEIFDVGAIEDPACALVHRQSCVGPISVGLPGREKSRVTLLA